MMKRILSWFRRRNNNSKNTPGGVEKFLEGLVLAEENGISCDDVHELLDQFAELELAGEDVARLMPLVQKHLDLCPDCREEHDVLLQAIRYERQTDET